METSRRAFGLLLVSALTWLPCWLGSSIRANQPEGSSQGSAITLWDGKETFGWEVPKGKTSFNDGPLWWFKTPLGPGKLEFEYGPQTDTGTIRVAIKAGERGQASEEILTIEPKPQGGVETFRATAPTYRLGLKTFGINLKAIRFSPSGMKSLFNGKDLEGWVVYPGKKTDFTWNPAGFLSVKNGPGDLQSKETFDHFLAQVDIKTNGKHLNSGIFFKALPGEYWKGYESQIRNQFNPTEDQKYTVEQYDPKTNKLVSKETVMSRAVDYGTGAIYRRLPTRVEASKDGEWFTMTIAVHGRHIATWVNGVQTVDWTDNRPENNNPREGYRVAPGAFSIQGHDPTTDIDFRNFRVLKLKP